MAAIKIKVVVFIFLCVLIFGNFNFAAGETLNLNPIDAVKNAGIRGINAGDVLDAFKFNLFDFPGEININTDIPISPKVNEFQNLPDSNDIDLKQFLTLKDVSSDDLGEAIKAVITLVIEIFLVVISVVFQILKLILGFLR
ncbi:MAG: hypothetical protein A3J46_00895 [Candidatus Yanofskybacteria bacterium RIFCSPHIGHO2_02_FULL_41_11]|uniref:Uncharacterized protein n=1 Tax=Candidatus Yanofskybacteria bacterium RIFCSPHIGHO2_02_FULL_41_11 TaxID=1802675 RepID=A0A1F8F6J7_9BACT|nr:MAG: hypothetical protein A3J46_00895 [Candidatus Yanofskybacteria bacterium RIFCSPHIGHO2_02_FULL_41_11]